MTKELRENLIREIEKLHKRNELSKTTGPDYFEPGMMEYLEQSEGSYNEESGEFLIRFEAKGTRYDGRTEQIEKVKTGDLIHIVREKENSFNSNNFRLMTKRNQDVGNMPAELCNVIAPLYDLGELTIEKASVSFVEPISKRSRHAKQAVLFVELRAKIKERRRAMAKGNVLAQYEESFEKATEEQLTDIAKSSIINFIGQSGMKTPDKILQLMMIGAKAGISSKDGILTDKQKRLASEVFESTFNGLLMDQVYPELSKSVTEAEMEFLKLVGRVPFGIEFLKYILAFAYIDGTLDADMEEQLEKNFGVALLAGAFSDMSESTEDDEEECECSENECIEESECAEEENEPTEEEKAPLELTEEELKVYRAIEKNDHDGRGLDAAFYYELYGFWNLPKLPLHGTDEERKEYLQKFLEIQEKNDAELNMTKERFCEIIYSLAERGIVRKVPYGENRILYAAGEVKAEDIKIKAEDIKAEDIKAEDIKAEDIKAETDSLAEEKKIQEHQEDEKMQYEEELRIWYAECEKIKTQRDKMLLEEIEKEKTRLKNVVKNEYDKKIEEKQMIISENMRCKTEAEQKLSEISGFKFLEKQAQKLIIEKSAKRISEAEAIISKINMEYRNQMKKLEEKLEEKEDMICQEIGAKMSFPQCPGNTENLTETQKINEKYKDAVKIYLADGDYYTVEKIRKRIPELRNLEPAKITSLLSSMYKDGSLQRGIENGTAYFFIE